MMTENGYPFEWFVEPIDAYLVCGICGLVLKDSRATKCGHVFCHKCLCTWIDQYGVCPERCGEVELESLRRAQQIDKKISCLLTSCKYSRVGCKARLQLSDKESHEKKCHYAKKSVGRTKSFPFFNFGSSSLSQPDPPSHSHKQRSKSFQKHRLLTGAASDSEKDIRASANRRLGHHHQKHQRSNSLAFGAVTKVTGLSRRTPSCATVFEPRIPKPMRMQSQHTFRLKRTKPGESLGLVLVSGEKTADGKPESFYVKKVNPDTLAWRAGLKAGDRIVQVDYYSLSAIHPQEAVARIKDKPLVTLTILRGLVPPSRKGELTQDHIYDEILYADQQLSQQNLSQQEDFSQFMTTGLLRESSFSNTRRHRTALNDKDIQRPNTKRQPTSPGERPTCNGTLPGEKGSKDSGLSSGSSNSPEHQREKGVEGHDGVESPEDVPFERLASLRQSYRTEREMLKNFLKTKKKDNQVETEEPDLRRNCRIEGEYEVEEIYLQKSGTSQLGVTLGYDTKTAKGRLYVCEILPTGLAYQDGRLNCGDIIQRVNGFEVYDPEEAILLFLEQDQDITLTVARKIKAVTNRLVLSNQPNPPAVEHTYAVLEAKVTGSNVPLRRIDSCGSLDSHSHKYAKGYNKADLLDEQEKQTEHAQKVSMTASRLKMNEEGYEYMSRTRSSSNPRSLEPVHQLSVRQDIRSSSRSPPRHASPLCYSVGHLPTAVSPPHSSPRQQSVSPDSSFQTRPKTTSNEHIASDKASDNVRPSSTTPDNRLRVNIRTRNNYEPKIMSPTDGTRKVPVSFKTLSSGTCKLPNRCESNDFAFARSESLV